MSDHAAMKNSTLRQVCLMLLLGGAVSMLMPAAFADYADCLGGPRQTDTLRNPLIPGAPSAMPGQLVTAVPPPPGSGPIPNGVIPGDLGGPAPVTTGYADPTNGSIFPAWGSQGAKGPWGYVPGAGRYPTKSGYQQGMYDFGQGMYYGQNTYQSNAGNAGMPTYESGAGAYYGTPSYDWGQGLYGTPTYESGAGAYYGTPTYESGAQQAGIPTYDPGIGNYGQRSYDWGQGVAGQGIYQSGAGNYGQKTYEQGSEMSGTPTYDNGYGNGGTRRYDNGGGGVGTRTYDNGAGNGGTQYYSGRGRGGSVLYDNGTGNGGAKLNEGGAGNGGTSTTDFGTEASGNRITANPGAKQGARGVVNNGGPRSGAQGTQDNVFAHSPQPNLYDFQGPLPTVRTFSRYLVILGVVVACIWVAMASISVVMGNQNGPARVIGAVGGLLLLLAGYTIWKVVQMNTFHANSTGYWSNTRGQAQPRQYNGPVNLPTANDPPPDPGATPAAPGPGGNQQDQRPRTGPNNYRPTQPLTPGAFQGPYNYRPQGPYTGHPEGPDLVGSYDIPPANIVPEPPESPVINPNKY